MTIEIIEGDKQYIGTTSIWLRTTPLKHAPYGIDVWSDYLEELRTKSIPRHKVRVDRMYLPNKWGIKFNDERSNHWIIYASFEDYDQALAICNMLFPMNRNEWIHL